MGSLQRACAIETQPARPSLGSGQVPWARWAEEGKGTEAEV